MNEMIMFLLGVSFGGLLMLFIILRLIAGMHDRLEQNLGYKADYSWYEADGEGSQFTL